MVRHALNILDALRVGFGEVTVNVSQGFENALIHPFQLRQRQLTQDVYKRQVSNSPVVKNGKKKTNNWLDHQDVCQKLKISKRTLQTLRDNGTLAYTKIGNRTYYLPEDVESIVTKVEDRRKEARWRGREI